MRTAQMVLNAHSTGTAPQHHPITSHSYHPLGFWCVLVIWTNTVCVVVLVEIRLRTKLKWLSHMMLKRIFVLCAAKFKEHSSVYILPFVVVSVCRYACMRVCACACVCTSLHACVHTCVCVYHYIGLCLFFNPSLQCFSGAHHPVDSSELAFMTAADFAVRQGKL